MSVVGGGAEKTCTLDGDTVFFECCLWYFLDGATVHSFYKWEGELARRGGPPTREATPIYKI